MMATGLISTMMRNPLMDNVAHGEKRAKWVVMGKMEKTVVEAKEVVGREKHGNQRRTSDAQVRSAGCANQATSIHRPDPV